jgi:hypothetical protein
MIDDHGFSRKSRNGRENTLTEGPFQCRLISAPPTLRHNCDSIHAAIGRMQGTTYYSISNSIVHQ